jgi:hypothetical protein
LEKTSVPPGIEKVIVASLGPGDSPLGMVKMAVTTYWLEWVTELPLTLPIMTL